MIFFSVVDYFPSPAKPPQKECREGTRKTDDLLISKKKKKPSALPL